MYVIEFLFGAYAYYRRRNNDGVTFFCTIVWIFGNFVSGYLGVGAFWTFDDSVCDYLRYAWVG